MGSCISKKVSTPPLQAIVKDATTIVPGGSSTVIETPPQDIQDKSDLINHGKSHDRDRRSTSDEEPQATRVAIHPRDNNDKMMTVVRTSSCTKEELDAILIQCGRLSRSSSGNLGGKSYSGSKRSYDFDHQDDAEGRGEAGAVTRGCRITDSNEEDLGRRRGCRSRPSPTRDQGERRRRRTPSREREQQRSSSASRERRMSRSPGRRADNTNASLSDATSNGGGSKLPVKMVSVPATVNGADKNKSSLEPKAAASVGRVSVKRSLGAGHYASPRSQSPVKQTTSITKAADNGIQQPSLSRSSSRKAEKSPYRRNPLGEIDTNASCHSQKPALLSNQKCHAPANKENEAPLQVKAKLSVDACSIEEGKAALGVDLYDVHQAPGRIKSSREFEFGVEKDHHQGSYTSLLLQDIQKFHQNQAVPPSFSLPPCVVKACSIYDAVAGLNAKSSAAFSSGKNIGASLMTAKSEAKDPFVESELAVDDDLMEPSILKYVTVKRGGMLRKEEDEEQESSGSNTLFLGSAGAEPGLTMAADSPNCGTSISSGTRMSAISGKVLLYG